MSSTYQSIMGPFFAAQSQLAESLHQTAMQQASLQQAKQQFQADIALRQQQQKDYENQGLANALKDGGQIVDPSGNMQATAPTSTTVSNPSSGTGSISSDGNLTMNPNGTGLMQALTNAGGAQVPVTADQGRTVSLAGRQVQVATPQDRLALEQQEKDADYNRTTIPVTQAMSSATGGVLPVGTRIPAAHAALIYQTVKANNQKNTTPPNQIITGTKQEADKNGNLWNIITLGDGSTVAHAITTPDGKPFQTGDVSGGAAPKQLSPYEQLQQNRQAKQDADQAEYQGVMNDVLARANGDPAAARTLLVSDATASKDNPARRQLSAATKQLMALQGKPDEVQAFMTKLNGPDQPSPAQRAGMGGGASAPAAATPQASAAPATTLPAKPTPRLPVGNGKKLTDQTIAQRFIDASGGDKQKARQLALQNGWKL